MTFKVNRFHILIFSIGCVTTLVVTSCSFNWKKSASAYHPSSGNSASQGSERRLPEFLTGNFSSLFKERKLKLRHNQDTNIILTENMTSTVIDDLFYKFVTTLNYACEDSIRLGKASDGGWEMCAAEPYTFHQPCLVYSFGINNDFSFDDAVSANFGCTVRAFDPSMNVKDHKRGTSIWFYQAGIGASDIDRASNGWKLRTLQTLIKEMNDINKIIDYLKIDVEGAEWDSFEAIFKTDLLQSRVKQLGMEIHLEPHDASALYKRWKLLKKVEDLGFRRWYWHFNSACAYTFNGQRRSSCYEIIYINIAFMKRTTEENK